MRKLHLNMTVPTADGFRDLAQAFKDAEVQAKKTAEAILLKQRRQYVDELINTHLTDVAWQDLLGHAQKAAAHGQREYLLLRFPSELCSDDSRAINNPPNTAWPKTLRGEAADIYARWYATLRPQGFQLAAQVLTFPGGIPGDVGLFLRWGEKIR